MKTLSLFLSFIISVSALAQQTLNRRVLRGGFESANGQVKVAFFDADSTLRIAPSGSVSANSDKDVMILPFVSQRIAELNKAGYLVMIVSNQGGVGKGLLPITTADNALQYTTELISAENKNAQFNYIDFADQEDNKRKPLTGMAEDLFAELAQLGLQIDLDHSFMVGDSAYKKGQTRPDGKPGSHFSDSDRQFAENLKIRFYEPNDFFGWRCHNVDVFDKVEVVQKYMQEHRTRCAVIPNL